MACEKTVEIELILESGYVLIGPLKTAEELTSVFARRAITKAFEKNAIFHTRDSVKEITLRFVGEDCRGEYTFDIDATYPSIITFNTKNMKGGEN